MTNLDLTRPCDACGGMIGGGFKQCPKCQIYFCYLCSIEPNAIQKELSIKCPMCEIKMGIKDKVQLKKLKFSCIISTDFDLVIFLLLELALYFVL